ncbi:GTPase IMAP family member 4 [Collichthys lucidus]|uniref:GTPase IMAP family member 4 n=1 Tax=Collichthys lucidus TaxID=240159 RepID=A0A4U5VNT0_COLLU|nr:GTPase IMAP family member 4 [Collichthys lucidus]
MECQCDKDEDAVAALPALIRWPIRLFCSLTGLTALWGWGSRACVNGWLESGGLSHGLVLLSEQSQIRPAAVPNKPGLRLILLGPKGGGRTSLAVTLLGSSETITPIDPLMESTKRRMVIDGREVTVIDTPDLLGTSLGDSKRAREALRSLQLTSPGPHAFLLVMRAPGSSMEIDQDVAQEVRATLELFGDGAMGYILPVLTHADHLGRKHSVDKLLDADTSLKKALSLCDQRPELVDNRPDCPPEAQTKIRRELLGRVIEMDTLRGHFVHELQRREDRIREELLDDMASALARKVGHM